MQRAFEGIPSLKRAAVAAAVAAALGWAWAPQVWAQPQVFTPPELDQLFPREKAPRDAERPRSQDASRTRATEPGAGSEASRTKTAESARRSDTGKQRAADATKQRAAEAPAAIEVVRTREPESAWSKTADAVVPFERMSEPAPARIQAPVPAAVASLAPAATSTPAEPREKPVEKAKPRRQDAAAAKPQEAAKARTYGKLPADLQEQVLIAPTTQLAAAQPQTVQAQAMPAQAIQAPAPHARASEVASDGACKKPVYLTFDTGHMGVAPLVAEVLKRHQVPVTFFMASEKTRDGGTTLDETWAPWWRDRAAEGHLFASHTWDHWVLQPGQERDRDGSWRFKATQGERAGTMVDAGAQEYCEQLRKPARRFQEMTGGTMAALFRAPAGRVSQPLLEAAKACGFEHVGWSAAGFLGDELDSRRYPNDKLLKQALRDIRSGDVLVAHLGIWSRQEPWAPAVLEPLVTGLKSKGFCFATLRDHPKYRDAALQKAPLAPQNAPLALQKAPLALASAESR